MIQSKSQLTEEDLADLRVACMFRAKTLRETATERDGMSADRIAELDIRSPAALRAEADHFDALVEKLLDLSFPTRHGV